MTMIAQTKQKSSLEQKPDPNPPLNNPLRLEACAEMERHFQEQDRLIAAWLAPRGSRRLNVSYVAGLRETHFSWWARLEYRALTEVRPPLDLAAREYLPGYVRPSVRHASLMERACPTWLICCLMGVAALWFFAGEMFPHQAEALVDFLKGLF